MISDCCDERAEGSSQNDQSITSLRGRADLSRQTPLLELMVAGPW
jgi:hypothetical protein